MTIENPGQTGARSPASRTGDPRQEVDRGAPQRSAGPGGSSLAGTRPLGPRSAAPGVTQREVGTQGTTTAGDRAQRREQARQARDEVAARTRPARPRTRRAHLRASRLDPWSVMKVAFMLSIAVAIVGVIAVVVLWSALSAADVFNTVNSTVRDQATFGTQAQRFDVLQYVGLNRVLGVALLLAVVNVILATALATLFSFVYNLTAGLLGGIEVTLAETE